jgi:putative NADPH-quinone reductase
MHPRRIVIIQGHPDADPRRFCRALVDAYIAGARDAGHEVRLLDVTTLDFPVLRTREAWERGPPPEAIVRAQDDVRWADHVVLVFPLWLGALPALLKAFLEQLFRPGFAFTGSLAQGGKRQLGGRSARLVVTMGMPALVYRWYFGAHSLRSLERNVLRFCGISPVRDTIIGMVESGDGRRRTRWLERMRALGRRGA